MDDTTKVALGLFAAWVPNDIEELITMSANSARFIHRVPAWVPLPDALRRDGVSQAHVNLGIGMMAAVMAAFAAEGVRTDCRSPWFRGALLAFGLHGFGHIASCLPARGYASGVLTSPTVVIPYWWWASRVLRREGIRQVTPGSVALAASGIPIAWAVHALTYAILGERSVRTSA